MSIRSTEIESKWQERWYSARINEVDNDGRPKFMLIFAYPGVTGYLHVGHMRGYTYVDAIGRYKRLEGYNVMFPVGTHATGNGTCSSILERRTAFPSPTTPPWCRRRPTRSWTPTASAADEGGGPAHAPGRLRRWQTLETLALRSPPTW